MATETFKYSYVITSTTPYNFTVELQAATTTSVYDVSDDNKDNLNQLGDIQPDAFKAQSGGTVAGLYYVGETSDKKSVVGVYDYAGPNQTYFLFTNNKYVADQTVTVDSAPFAITCFASGTLIRTPRGELPVERLAVGDLVVTASGAERPIRWIGHRHSRFATHPAPRKVWPYRVRADAFGAGLPHADLWLSPGHALCFDDVLVPVRCLHDGEAITQVEVDEITYWHVELDDHDVLVANGLPAESYIDTGNRRGFDNAPQPTKLHFDEDPAPGWDGTGTCLPLVESGPRLSAIRARLLGKPAPAAALPHLVVDGVALAAQQADECTLVFVLPAGANEVRLVSSAFQPVGADVRRLGVIVNALAVSDGGGWREVGLDDPGLYAGFHDVERGEASPWRWTDGEAHLSRSLWAGLDGPVLLRVGGLFAGFGPAAAGRARRAA